MASQCPTFLTLLAPGPRPRILLRKLDINIFRRVVPEPIRGLWLNDLATVQVLGGVVTTVVIKDADNIMKGLATSLSSIISFLASIALFDFSITVPFVVGSSIVLGATWFNNQPAAEKPREVVHKKSGEDEISGMRVSLSSLSLKGSGRKSANVPGSAVDPNHPILGDMNPRRKSPLPRPGSLASAVKGFISRSSSPNPTAKADTSLSRLVESTEPRSTVPVLGRHSIRPNPRAGISQTLGFP